MNFPVDLVTSFLRLGDLRIFLRRGDLQRLLEEGLTFGTDQLAPGTPNRKTHTQKDTVLRTHVVR